MLKESALAGGVAAFSVLVSTFDGFRSSNSYDLEPLRKDPNWPWAYIHGVYVFIQGDDIVYVGRALSTTIGQRLWSHLRSLEEKAWADVVNDPTTRVEVIEIGDDHACLSAALEVFLIDRFSPRFNRKAC